ncbi:hypothetical protein GCM10009030_20510 [Haloarcula pellucida]|uniref:Uncharacterized protein n=1 Tax=Haloarcula pellucida TaxID=1427151 RepID=A0A830GLM2_9EURY|nr:hypothetical protein GCM10009030_20510 [Halomicroarcula pellucida]
MFTGESNHALADVVALPADPTDTPLSMCILALYGLFSSNSTSLSSYEPGRTALAERRLQGGAYPANQ